MQDDKGLGTCTRCSSSSSSKPSTRGGVPGTPCLLSIAMRSTTPGLGPVMYGATNPGVFDLEGRHDQKLAVPPGLSGLKIEFRTYGQYEPGVNGQSNALAVTVQ